MKHFIADDHRLYAHGWKAIPILLVVVGLFAGSAWDDGHARPRPSLLLQWTSLPGPALVGWCHRQLLHSGYILH